MDEGDGATAHNDVVAHVEHEKEGLEVVGLLVLQPHMKVLHKDVAARRVTAWPNAGVPKVPVRAAPAFG